MSYISFDFSDTLTADLIKRYKYLLNRDTYSFAEQESDAEEMQRISFEIRVNRNESFTV